MVEPTELDRHVQEILDDLNNLFYVSAVSVHEILMLYNSGRFRKKWRDSSEIVPSIKAMNYQLLPVKWEHFAAYAALQPVANHNDPFDHLIIAQAIAERMPLISSDSKFKYYVNQKLTLIENER
jgi:PIN domain nuclease of toxin-antitoxin system